MKKFFSKESLVILFWFFLVISFAILLTSCHSREKVVVKKCIVTHIEKSKPRSTIESDYKYIYHTDCGTRVITNKPHYDFGDTIYYYKFKDEETHDKF